MFEVEGSDVVMGEWWWLSAADVAVVEDVAEVARLPKMEGRGGGLLVELHQ